MYEKIQLKQFWEEDGALCPIEFSSIKFVPKRIFYVHDVPANSERGMHAHYKTEQLLICAQGQILVKLFDGKETHEIQLKQDEAVYVPPMIWDSQVFMTGKDILVSLASTNYDPKDYINDIEEFKSLTNSQ